MSKDKLHLLFINYPLSDKKLPPGHKLVPSSTPNLAFGGIGTIAHQMDCKITYIDANFYLRPYNTIELIHKVLELKPDLIGCTLFVDNILFCYDFINLLKQHYTADCTYVAGGPHSTVLPEEPLKYGFDISCRGEGEKPIKGLVDYLKGNVKLADIKGISYFNENNEIITNPCIDIEYNLDSIPLVNYDLFDELYFTKENLQNSKFQVFTSRGCPSLCTYCNSFGVFGSKVRYRSVDNVIEELEMLNKKHGVMNLNFVDDYFTLKNQRVSEICEQIISNDINISWGCYSKSGAIRKDLFSLMKSAGCNHIGYGVENVDPGTLKRINKKNAYEEN